MIHDEYKQPGDAKEERCLNYRHTLNGNNQTIKVRFNNLHHTARWSDEARRLNWYQENTLEAKRRRHDFDVGTTNTPNQYHNY